MDTGKVSGLLRTNQGYAFITLVEVKPSALPGLQDVRPRLRDDVIRVKSIEVARTKAAAFVQAARTNFAGAAKAAGAAIKSTDFVARGSTYPDVGVSEKLDTVVFSLPTGGVSQPVPTETAVVVAHVTNRQDIVTSELDAQRENLRTQITDERRNEFFGAYMQKARDKMSIEYNDAVVQTLLGRN
jgi:parvulin-like peptidyl-prolyl isomerase